jgi:triacylglycerol esterase/lipase EstA (alpha/beta hydrolase family)
MWTAITLAAALVAGLSAYGLWAVHAVAQGASAWLFVAGLPLAYMAVPFVFASIWFALAWWFHARRPTDVRLTLRARLSLFGHEVVALARSPIRMIFYRFLITEPRAAPAALPILLLHGVGCNAGVWHGFLRYLDSRGIGPVYTLSYGPPLAAIEHFASQVAGRIAEIRSATGASQVVLIGHSMGGLVARAYLRQYGGARVRRLITIGTPHHGSMHAWLMTGICLSQMRPGSEWLAGLAETAGQTGGVPVVSVWSWHDSMVTPQTSSRIKWGRNIVVSGVAHNALLDDRNVWTLVAAEIVSAAAAAPATDPESAAAGASARRESSQA